MRFRWRALFLPLCIAILLMAAAAVPLPVFLERPGPVASLTELVDVGPAPSGEETQAVGEVDGDYLLTVVNLRRATLVLLVHGLLAPDVSTLPAVQLTGGVDDATYFGRQREVFATTADVAAALGLQAAGFPIEFGTPRGVLVAEVFPGAPAAGALEPGDIVTTIDDTDVRSTTELVAAVRAVREPTMEVEFVREDEERRVQITRGAVPGIDQPGLGVRVEDLIPAIDLPVPVDIDATRIGGPSAGLMIALTVYDKAAPEDLAAGRRVAGTGGVTLDGTVTPIGGIELKVLAAHREGADVFLAPASQAADAQTAVPPGSALQVVGVATVDDAIQELHGTATETVRAAAA